MLLLCTWFHLELSWNMHVFIIKMNIKIILVFTVSFSCNINLAKSNVICEDLIYSLKHLIHSGLRHWSLLLTLGSVQLPPMPPWDLKWKSLPPSIVWKAFVSELLLAPAMAKWFLCVSKEILGLYKAVFQQQ